MWQKQSQELTRVNPDRNIFSIERGTNIYFSNSTEVWSITITEFYIYIYSALKRIDSPVQVIFEDSQCTACGVIGSKLYALKGGGCSGRLWGKIFWPLALYFCYIAPLTAMLNWNILWCYNIAEHCTLPYYTVKFFCNVLYSYGRIAMWLYGVPLPYYTVKL